MDMLAVDNPARGCQCKLDGGYYCIQGLYTADESPGYVGCGFRKVRQGKAMDVAATKK
jgi:hypothetical protein